MQEIMELIMGNTLYMGIAAVVLIGLLIFIMKKVFKLFLIIVAGVLAYGAFLYMTEDDPVKAIKEKLSMGQSTMKKLDEATQGIQDEAIDRVIQEVDKKLKKK